MSSKALTAVVLARGLGSRMRQPALGATLEPDQEAAAAAGLKMMIPDGRGRPFLDHVLSRLADGGITRVVLVVAPNHDAIHSHYRAHPPHRVQLEWVIQREPRGTADAVLAAEPTVIDLPFLVVNADNLYPVNAIGALVSLGSPGLAAFDRAALIQDGNIDPDRVRAFALLQLDAAGNLKQLIEKPDAEAAEWMGDDALVSMNLWRFDEAIFPACRGVPASIRGERELPDAVMLAVEEGVRFRAVLTAGGVLDLSQRGDVAAVAARLAELPCQP